MTNEEYVRHIGEIYNHVMSLRKDEDYVINQPQMDKLVDIVKFFMTMTEKLSGKLEPVKLTPREEHGDITATFLVFDLCGSDIERFCDVVRHASAITIDATADCRVCISITVPNVFVPVTPVQ